MRHVRRTLIVIAAAVCATAAGCGGGAPEASPGIGQQTITLPVRQEHASGRSRIVVIPMENKSFDQVVGSADAPYLNRLMRRQALLTRFYGIRHPSLGDYLALTAGSTFGMKFDCLDCRIGGRNLVDQLEEAGISWKAYMEDMPRRCYRPPWAAGQNYAKKHNPFAYYDTVMSDPARCRKIVPAEQLTRDARRGRLPTFTWITPNQCNDMHSCDVAAGDRFLARVVPGLLRQLGRNGFLVVTWDEGNDNDGCCRLAAGGHVPTVIAGPGVRRAQWDRPANLYSLLRLFEDSLRLPRLRAAGCPCTPSLDGAFTQPPRLR